MSNAYIQYYIAKQHKLNSIHYAHTHTRAHTRTHTHRFQYCTLLRYGQNTALYGYCIEFQTAPGLKLKKTNVQKPHRYTVGFPLMTISTHMKRYYFIDWGMGAHGKATSGQGNEGRKIIKINSLALPQFLLKHNSIFFTYVAVYMCIPTNREYCEALVIGTITHVYTCT